MAPWLPRPRAAGARPRRLSGWTAVVPVAAAVAGLLFATSAQTAKGTDLRATGRTDLVDVIRNQTFAVERQAASVQRLQAEVDQLTARSSPGSAAVQQGAQPGRPAGAPGRHRAGQRPRAQGHPRRRQAHRREPAGRLHRRRHRGAPAGRAERGQRAVGRRRRGDDAAGPARDLHQRGPVRRQHPAPAGPGLLPALRHHRGRRRQSACARSWTPTPRSPSTASTPTCSGCATTCEDKARLTLPAYAGSLDLVHARAGG